LKIILQVDDDPNDVFLLRHAMRKVGIDNPVQVVRDGQEAIDYLSGAGKFADREQFPFPMLVLMDLKLPYVMGLDVLRWIGTQSMTSLIVIMLTASADEPEITEAYRLGANAFLTKPSEASKLEDMLKAIKGFWLTHNTVPAKPSLQSAELGTFSLRLSRQKSKSAENLFRVDVPTNNTLNGNAHPGPLPAQSPLNPRQPNSRRPQRAAPDLSRRQIEVMQLIAKGFSSREIARQFSLSIKTVEKHRQALMKKLKIHEIATLTRYAVSCGLVECKRAPEAMERFDNHEITVGLSPDSEKNS